ncbi:hypothetical protein C9J21_19930 [Photobacterium phosphoreum]|uniref:hypothetical protein n=1 Tax=Photobacterium phosphoreum TaxID=659 RepID=UPI000D15A4B5|nr:hypothetical protein [Photobacterium phosphoreum]PSW29158.1 hypothetical protein C9J21_19930 [Photobacterium phosphoreum]
MTVSIQKFIENNYGNKRGAEAAFLRDNQHIGTTDNARKAQLWRWKKLGFLVDLDTGHVYQPTITINQENLGNTTKNKAQ